MQKIVGRNILEFISHLSMGLVGSTLDCSNGLFKKPLPDVAKDYIGELFAITGEGLNQPMVDNLVVPSFIYLANYHVHHLRLWGISKNLVEHSEEEKISESVANKELWAVCLENLAHLKAISQHQNDPVIRTAVEYIAKPNHDSPTGLLFAALISDTVLAYYRYVLYNTGVIKTVLGEVKENVLMYKTEPYGNGLFLEDDTDEFTRYALETVNLGESEETPIKES